MAKVGQGEPRAVQSHGFALVASASGERAAGPAGNAGQSFGLHGGRSPAPSEQNQKSNGEWFYFPSHLPARIKGTRGWKTQVHSANPKVWCHPLPQQHPSQGKTLLSNSNKAQLSLFNHPVGSGAQIQLAGWCYLVFTLHNVLVLGSAYLTDWSTSNSASRLARTARCRVLQKKTKIK